MKDINFNVILDEIPVPSKMPSPPDYLLSMEARLAANSEEKKKTETKPEPSMPSAVDNVVFQQAIEDRKNAEIHYAEIYSQYLEVVSFNERLIRRIRRFGNFRQKVRQVYNKAKISDQILAQNLQLAQRHLIATEKAASDLQLENESLRLTAQTHQETFASLNIKISQAEGAMRHASQQFQNLADEYDKRGSLLLDADRKIKAYVSQIAELDQFVTESRSQLAKMRDENLLFQNQSREAQMREAGLATLNQELTESITKLQHQIHDLEDKIYYEREHSKARILGLEQEAERLKDKRYAESLVAQSKIIQAGQITQPASMQDKIDIIESVVTAPSRPEEPTLKERPVDRRQWDDFLNRWNHIIDELSSHSAPLKKSPSELPTVRGFHDQLMSERGDLEELL